MKKEKRNFLGSTVSYILAFVCITSWIALGIVLALTSVNISVNGGISFTANDVYADVTGTVTGTATTNTLEDIHLTADTTSFTTPSSWSNITFDFFNEQDIVFTINITNKSTERSLWVKFTDSISVTGTAITRKSAGTEVRSLDTLAVPKSTSKSVEITLHISDLNKSVSGKFNLGLNLTSEEPAYPTLTFTYNDSAKTATIRQNYSNEPTGNLVIPSSVLHNGEEYIITTIENYAFWGCSSLTSITIPEGVTSIGESTFQGCSALTSITIPSGVTSIESQAFYGCSALTSITIPESVTGIGRAAFYGCSSLTSITIPEGVTSIGDATFKGCSKLTSVTIPANVSSIEFSAFENCSSLTSITIPENVTRIGQAVFRGCSSLTSITIPSGVTSIESQAFYGCSSLTSISIPSSVTRIGSYAFEDCSKLTSATFENTTGWKAGNTTLSSSSLADASTAATFLKHTYRSSMWTRS